MKKTTGLSLYEAHASGRMYRRPGWKDGYYSRYEDDGETYSITIQDALADDYSLEPEAKLLTREEVRAAIDAETLALNPMYRGLWEIVYLEPTKLLDRIFGPEDEE